VGKWREAMNKVGGISGFVFDTRWCISSTPFSLAFCCSWGWGRGRGRGLLRH
jgi:hypothetical protein